MEAHETTANARLLPNPFSFCPRLLITLKQNSIKSFKQPDKTRIVGG